MICMPKQMKNVWAIAIPLLVGAGPAHAAVIDVSLIIPPNPPVTYDNLDDAFAAAAPDDIIVLDGPTVLTDPPTVYTLTAGLVVNAAKDGVTIRGKSQSRPDLIQINFAGGPVITVNEERSLTLNGLSITGGTTGVLAMADSTVDIERCLFDGIAGVAVDCVDVDSVTLKSTIIANSTSEATRIDMGGALNIIQCSFVNNGSFGVEALAGVATVEATLIHDSDDGTNGVSGTATTLTVSSCWITDLGGTSLPLPAGVTDTYTAIIAPLDPVVVFDATGYPAQLADASQEQATGQPAASFSTIQPTLDFAKLLRNPADLVVGADEPSGSAGTAAWTECFVVQRGIVRRQVGEGFITVEVTTPSIDLSTAALFIGHNDALIPVTAEFLGPYPLETSGVDADFGIVEIPILEEDFITAFPSAGSTQDDYLIYIHTLGGPTTDTANLYGSTEGTAETGQAITGRVFGLDTLPPTVVTDFNLLADQYLAAAADAGALDPGPWGPDAGALLGNVGANAGHLDGTAAEPQIFFDAFAVPPSGFTIRVDFADVGTGFETVNLPDGSTTHVSVIDKSNALFTQYDDSLGMARWEPNSESDAELISSTASLEVTFTNPGGPNTLRAEWHFDDLPPHDLTNQWHAIANIRATDLAGNEVNLDLTGVSYIPLKPLHLWWFPDVLAKIHSGPASGETTDPRFSWGLERLGGGQSPKDPYPCVTGAQWSVWIADAPGVPATSWTSLTAGLWSNWLDPVTDASIALGTYFDATTTLRDLVAGNPPGSEYLLAVIGYDEAGNLQPVPGLVNLVDASDLDAINVSYDRWTDPGLSDSLGLDTVVRPVFWHNNVTGLAADDRRIDGDETVYGGVSRIPLPDPGCVRVEGKFSIALGLPSNVAPADRYFIFRLFEDGREVVRGTRQAPTGTSDLVIPQDLINVPADLALGWPSAALAFLNTSPVCAGQDRLGDEGDQTAEPGFRRRHVKYLLEVSSAIDIGLPDLVYDETPATVEFTVTVPGGTRNAEQAIKQFKRE